MDLLTGARRLESLIARTVERAAQRVGGSGGRSPLEVVHAVLEAVDEEVVSAGRGRRVFPFNTVRVHLVAASAGARARYDALVHEPPTLGDRVVERLRGAGVAPGEVDVRVAYWQEARPGWRSPEFHVEFARTRTAPDPRAPDPAPRVPVGVAVVAGRAMPATATFDVPRIDLGRGVEVRDARRRLLRTNHVAFTEAGDEIDRSVSRRHAHITCDPASGHCRVFDDGSAHGTTVLRDGHAIAVRSGSRGVRLRDGDEIALGDARVRVSLPARP